MSRYGLKDPRGIRQRLLRSLLLPLFLVFIFGAAIDYRLAKQTSELAYDQTLADNVLDLGEHLRQSKAGGDIDLSDETEAMLRSNAPDIVYYAIRDAKGNTLAGDDSLPARGFPRDHKVSFYDGEYQGQKIRVAVGLARQDGVDLQVIVAETTKKRAQSRRSILSAMIFPLVFSILAIVAIVLWGVRRGLLPLHEVEEDLAKRSANDLHPMDLNKAPEEIQPMVQRLNALFGRVRESASIQQRFIADAAHQLRTPLTGLQTQIDLAAGDGAFSANPERLARIEEANARISHLLNQLLLQARAEAANEMAADFSLVDLGQLLERAANLFIDAALAKNIDLGFDIHDVQVMGSGCMLQEALGNLIDNAIRYTPAGGVITVRCSLLDQRACLEVEDSGPGIPEAHRQQVFERFYRMPGAGGNGCGLGLGIVSEIARLHRADVVLDRSAMGGLQVRFIFPYDSAPSHG